MPLIGQVIGTIWGTAKYPGLEDAKIQLLQPMSAQGEKLGTPIAAVDTVGAGPGEKVFYVTAYEAVIPYHRPMVPIDASIVGIIDRIDLADSNKK
jgi:ethanolamine utilization protein EutN